MKKVLFIIQSYPSQRSANVLCDDKIMKEMLKTGDFEIHCMVYKFHGQSTYEEIDGLRIHRIKRNWWWDLYTYARNNETSKVNRGIVHLNRLYMRFRQLCLVPIYPDYEPLLAQLMAKAAIKLQAENNYDLIVAEHSGRDTLYAGAMVKKKFNGVKLVSILWDPLSGRIPAKYLPKKYAQYMINKDEEKLLKYSDCIVCLKSNTKYQQLHSKNKPFYSRIHFLDIPGIIKPETSHVQDRFNIPGKINIIYSGILQIPDRDPSSIINLLNNSKFAEKINLMFFSAGTEAMQKAAEILKRFRGTSLVHPYIPKKELNSVASNADIFLNLGGPNPVMVPSKIFEYMSLGKPIISTYTIDNDSSKEYLDLYPSALCLDLRKNHDELITHIDTFIERKQNCHVPFETVKNLFPKNSPSEYIKIFNSLLIGVNR